MPEGLKILFFKTRNLSWMLFVVLGTSLVAFLFAMGVFQDGTVATQVNQTLSQESAVAGGEGHISFWKRVTPAFYDTYIKTGSYWPTINARYKGLQVFEPSFNAYVDSFTGIATVYRDAYAIYCCGHSPNRDGNTAEFALRDAAGDFCYIPYGDPFVQYAGDIGNPTFRSNWINYTNSVLAANPGYDGVRVDDVNLRLRSVACGPGPTPPKCDSVTGANCPIDPRTGTTMTEMAWKGYFATFVEEIRAAIPQPKIIQHNTTWFEPPTTDPYVIREVDAADVIQMEQGFTDLGLRGGTGKYSWIAKMAFVDFVHSRGKVVLDEDRNDEGTLQVPDDAAQEYAIANYFLFNNGFDHYDNTHKADPDSNWNIYGVDLGNATGAKYLWGGMWRRDFSNGFVLVYPPASTASPYCSGSSLSANLGGTYRDVFGVSFSSVTLSPCQGKVFLSSDSDTIPPTVSISSPTNGSTVGSDSTVTITASASDNVGVTRVEFSVDGSLLAPDTTSPYSASWNTTGLSAGSSHGLTAKAFDAAGNIGTSTTVTVTIADTSSSTETLSFIPTADAFIQANIPDTNYGSATTLEVDLSEEKNFLMKFSVTGVGTRTVQSATLRLYSVDSSDKGGDFYRVADASWAEGAVTWNNAPSKDAFIASLGSVSAGNWYDVNMTPLITGDGIFSLRVTSTSTNGADYSSKEGSFRPELKVIVSSGGDTTPPAAITNLAVPSVTDTTVTLSWTAPGDDGTTGTAVSYDVRYSTTTITDANWSSATQATGEPIPAVAGTTQSFAVSGLSASTTYFFAVTTSDEVPNVSGLSNVVSETTASAADLTAPTVSITSPTNGSTVSRNTTVTISASASDNIGVRKVEFSVSGSLKCTDTSSPYSCAWKVPSKRNATYTLTAKAYDASNNTASHTVTVTSK